METVNTPVNTDVESGKTYTSEQVEQIVEARLIRERKSKPGENAEKAQELEQKLTEAKAALQTASATIETLKGTSATAEEITAKLKASHEKIVASIPEDKRKFIPKGYSEAEQIAYITENSELFFSTSQILKPETVQIVNAQGHIDPEKFGGYPSLLDWAQNDPKGYQKARSQGKT